ncbi:integrase, catalytic region, zinc finger, CCHC-type containing protein [Tanacetum coccineum]
MQILHILMKPKENAQEDTLSTAMMLLARAITHHYSTPTNNRLRTSSNTRNQAVIQDGLVDIKSKNVGYAENGNRNAGRLNRNQATNAGNGLVQKIMENEENVQRIPRIASTPGNTNVQCYNCNGKGYYVRDCPKPRVRDAKYFREQMLLAAKDEAGVNLDTEENDFMLMNAYGDDQLEELNASVIMMARIQPTNDKSDAEPTYDAEVISKDNSGKAKHDPNAHDQHYVDIESLIYNVQVEAENQRKMNNELKKQNTLIQRELETYKERVKDFEKKLVQF